MAACVEILPLTPNPSHKGRGEMKCPTMLWPVVWRYRPADQPRRFARWIGYDAVHGKPTSSKKRAGEFPRHVFGRYSDYDGYWLFGFLIEEVDDVRIDLLAQGDEDATSPRGAAIQYAILRFVEQCRKAGLAPSQVQEACLTMNRLPGPAKGSVNRHPSDGHNLKFTAEAVTDLGRRYKQERVVFVAQHNAKIESRSTRATAEKNVGLD